jgi:cysteinyl-tRNA synthetase
LFKEFYEVFGLKFEVEEKELAKEIEELIEKREKARKERDWKSADKIREELKEKGIVLEDTPQGIRWKKLKKVVEQHE